MPGVRSEADRAKGRLRLELTWGLLGPATVADERRVRTLGLGAAVRRFNELAVPGLGAVWFGKQLVLATLGIQVAELAREAGLRVTNVECANAIEALACWLAMGRSAPPGASGHRPDPRVRGTSKLPREHGMAFKAVRQRSFYVSQPMRMGTTAALQPLGLAAGATRRFNSLELTDAGRAALRAAFQRYAPAHVPLAEHLRGWVRGAELKLKSEKLIVALSPLMALEREARAALLACLQAASAGEVAADTRRRRSALDWVEQSRLHPQRWAWANRPTQIEPDHWHDLHAGACFFELRDKALALLDAVEVQVAATPRECLPLGAALAQPVQAALHALRERATAFLALRHADPDATDICRHCEQASDTAVLQHLVQRDGRALRLAHDEVRPGGAFRRGVPPAPPDDDNEASAAPQPSASDALAWPPGTSFRIHNLYLLNLDLHNQLDAWLGQHGRARADA